MEKLYEFLSGPALWFTFAVLVGGLLARACFLYGLARCADKPMTDHFRWNWALGSIFHWLMPLGSVSLRQQPVFAIVVFIFHLGWIFTPIFLTAHNLLWQEAFGWRLCMLPEGVTDVLAMVVIACAAFLLVRRLVRPEVRILTGAGDYFLLLLAAAPFVTGFAAYHHWGDYRLMLNLHIGLSEILLILIPFTKLSHVILFFFTRSALATEMGARREEHGRLGTPVW